ncbi:MAG: anti-sigma factor family protein [Gemmatimonadaceae bacterium]
MTVHPTFDTLSSFADAAADDPKQARVRRHVRECDVCGEIVAEIRAMGAAARVMPAPHAPSDLWTKIETARADSELRPAIADERYAARTPSPTRGRLAKGIALAGAGIVLALAAGVLYPSRRSLQASALSRLTVRPARPAPGEQLIVRYDPAPYFRHERRLILAGWFSGPAGTETMMPRSTGYDLDSLGTLVRRSDGSFEGRVALPRDFRSMHVAVLDSAGERMDRDGRQMWRIVGGTVDHSPSLTSLLAAEEGQRHTGSFDNQLPSGPAFDVADTIRRYFPGHPAGWAFYRRFGVQQGVWDILGFFQSAERKYLALDEQLSERTALDVESLHAMFVLAMRIEEPGEALKWASRLARAYPSDAHAFGDLYGAIRELELRSTPGLRDSMRTWLPLLADTYHRGPQAERRYDEVAALVQRNGDAGMRDAWPLVREPEPKHGTPASHRKSVVSDGGQRAREQLSASCDRPAGRFSLYMSTARTVSFCLLQKSQLFVGLGEAALERRDLRGAIALADSAIAIAGASRWTCWPASDARTVRARASLALGDTTDALIDLAESAGRNGGAADRDEILARYPAIAMHRTEYDRLADSTRRAFVDCWAREKVKQKAHADSMRLGVR